MITLGICSGFFAPIHQGHLEYLERSYKYCLNKYGSTIMAVIINSDKQTKLKGSIPFLPEETREEIVEYLYMVDWAMVAVDDDLSVAHTLETIAKSLDYDQMCFFNAGDRNSINSNSKEHKVCQKYGIEEVWLDPPKINSSSKILEKVGQEWFKRRQNNEQN